MKHRSREELKMNHDSSSPVQFSKKSTKSYSPIRLKTSKVKQIVTKISQIMKINSTTKVKYVNLENDLSPEPEPQLMYRKQFIKPKAPLPTPAAEVFLGAEATPSSFTTPLPPKPRKKFVKATAPIPTPKADILVKIQPLSRACFVPEEVFAKLTVKEKALLYTEFVEEMNKRNSKFSLMESSKPITTNTNEVVVEKRVSVKDLLEELEFNIVFPKPTVPPSTVIERMNSMKKVCAARKSFDVNDKKSKDLPRAQVQVASEGQSPVNNDQNLTSDSIFQDEQMKNFFFSWFKEKHENVEEIDVANVNSATNKILKGAIAKSKTIKDKGNAEVPNPIPSERYKFENDFEFAKPLKPVRKKKLRKTPWMQKDVSQQEYHLTTSTDSETDCKQRSKHVKISLEIGVEAEVLDHSEPKYSLELNQSLLKAVNSPRKIKSAYTLTANDLETPVCTPRPSVKFAKQPQEKQRCASAGKRETLAHDVDINPLNKISVTKETQFNSHLSSIANSTKTNFDCSTPKKTREQHSFGSTKSAKRLFSPISKPTKNRRISFYDVESRLSSFGMHIIQEHQPLQSANTRMSGSCYETAETSRSSTKYYSFSNEADFSAIQKPLQLNKEKTSQFWIKCGDFSMALEINCIEKFRLRLLYESFSQNNCKAKDLYFGIDNNKFSLNEPLDMDNVSTRTSANQECSHYWFSNGELTIPFSGKILAAHKIQRLFRTVKETVEETGILRFGVDEIEFSNLPEFWHETPKFSVESQYNMLVGLQSGESDGLEGRSKYAWPNQSGESNRFDGGTKYSWPHSKPVMASDLDQADNEADNYAYENIDFGRLSCAPFATNHNNLASLNDEELSKPRNSLAMMNLELFCDEYENESLDTLFDDICKGKNKKLFGQDESEGRKSVADAIKNESAVQQQPADFAESSIKANDSIDIYKANPNYEKNLKNIKNIVTDTSSNNFKADSSKELDSHMHFMSRYARVYLSRFAPLRDCN